MPAPISAISSDDHLKPHTWAKHPSLAGDSYFAFKQKVDFCLERGLALILAGDLFDLSSPDAQSVYFFNNQMWRMSRKGLPVWAIQGNHEISYTTPWLASSASGCPKHAHKQFFEIGGICFYGLDFQSVGALTKELLAIRDLEPNPQVLIAHQAWEDLMRSKKGLECSFSDVPFVNLLVTGDFHQHCVTRTEGASGQPLTVLSPGSQCLQNKAEDPDKYFFVLYDDLSFESVKLKSRRMERFKFRNPGSFEDELAQAVAKAHQDLELLPENISTPIFVVEYSEAIPNAHTRLRSALANRVHLFETPIEVKVKKEVKPVLNACGVLAQLESFRDDEDVYETSKRLLDAVNPAAEWDEIVNETTKGSAHAQRRSFQNPV